MQKNKIIVTFLLLFISTSLLSRDFFTVSVHPTAHPYGWHEEEVSMGAALELMELIAHDLNITVNPVTLPWARSIHEVSSGEIDAILTAFYTDERSKHMTFSIPYDYLETSVFVSSKKAIPFSKWDDLIGYTGLTIVGDSQGDAWDRFEEENLSVIRVVNLQQVFKLLSSGRADYAVFPKISTLNEIEKRGYFEKIINLPNPVTSQGIYFAISKKSKLLRYLPKINQKIDQYLKNGTYQKLRDKAFK